MGRKGLVVALVVLAVLSQGCEQVKARYTDWWEGVWLLDAEVSKLEEGGLLVALAAIQLSVIQLKDDRLVMACMPLLGCGKNEAELKRADPVLTGQAAFYKAKRLGERVQLDVNMPKGALRLVLERDGDDVMVMTMHGQRLRFISHAAYRARPVPIKAQKAPKAQDGASGK